MTPAEAIALQRLAVEAHRRAWAVHERAAAEAEAHRRALRASRVIGLPAPRRPNAGGKCR